MIGFFRPRATVKGLLYLLVAMAGMNPALAEPGVGAGAGHVYLHQGTPHDAFFSVDMQAPSGLVVGAAGRILSSADAGMSWQPQTSPTPLSLLGVASAGEHAIAVGQMGVIVRRVAGRWETRESGTQERLFDVDVNERGRSLAVGAFGTVLRSPDGGSNWEQLKPQWNDWFDDPDGRLAGMFEPSLYGVQVTASGTIYVCGELSLIMRSDNGGRSWEPLLAGTNSSQEVSPTLSAIRLTEQGLGFAVGQEGTVLRTRDAGKTWQSIELDSHANLLAVDVSPQGRVVVAGMRAMFVSDNAGDSWTRLRSDDFDRGWYSEVALTDGGPVAVGHRGNIVKLNAQQWVSMATPGEQ